MATGSTGVGGRKSTVEFRDDDLEEMISTTEKDLKAAAEKVIKASAESSKEGVNGSIAAAPLVSPLVKEAIGAFVPPGLKVLTDVAVDSSINVTTKLAAEHLPQAIDKSAESSISYTNKVIDKVVESTK